MNRSILTELQSLPSARTFPPFLGLKRGRALGVQQPAPQPDAAVQHAGVAKAPQALDPTGLLLLEAANQLRDLVEIESHRRFLHASQRRWAESDSEDEDAADDGCAPRDVAPSGPAESTGVSASFDATASVTASVTVASQSVSLGCSAESAAASVLTTAAPKRPCLDRQFALGAHACSRRGRRMGWGM